MATNIAMEQIRTINGNAGPGLEVEIYVPKSGKKSAADFPNHEIILIDDDGDGEQKQAEIGENSMALVVVPDQSDSTEACKKPGNSVRQNLALQTVPPPPPPVTPARNDGNKDPCQVFSSLSKEYFLNIMHTDEWKAIECPPTSSTQKACDLPISERIEGWIVEQRPRASDGRVDKFYYHQKSSKMFRSFITMLIFVKYGIYPKRWQQGSNPGFKNDSEMSDSKTRRKGRRIGWTPDFYNELRETMYLSLINDQERAAAEAEAAAFLKAAHQNLLKLDKKGPEAFLYEANQNLLNTFKKEPASPPGPAAGNSDHAPPGFAIDPSVRNQVTPITVEGLDVPPGFKRKYMEEEKSIDRHLQGTNSDDTDDNSTSTISADPENYLLMETPVSYDFRL